MNEDWCTYPAPPPCPHEQPPPPFPLPLHSPLWGGGGQPPTMALKNNFTRVTVELLVERSDLGPPTWSPRGGGGIIWCPSLPWVRGGFTFWGDCPPDSSQ